MPTVRKTCDEMLNDSYTRGAVEPIAIYEFDETHMYIINENTSGEYMVEIDNEMNKVVDCTCPHWVYRVGALNIPCKHIIAVAMKLGYTW